MNRGSRRINDEMSPGLPAWLDCDLFCIHDYAGTGAAPCGWRGRIHESMVADSGSGLRCPRCGGATLFHLPSDRADRDDA